MEHFNMFRSVPDEVLLEIFHFIDVEDIVTSVQDVCIRWKNVSQDRRLWLDLYFKPLPHRSDDEISELLKLMPHLKSFIFSSNCFDVDKVLSSLCAYCLELNTLVCDNIVLSNSHLELLLMCLPKLEILQLSQWQKVDGSSLDVISQFPNLKKLASVNIGPTSTYALKDGCKGFKTLENIAMVAYCAQDTVGGDEQGNLCTSTHFLYYIPKCKNLQFLSIDFRMLHFSGFETVFSGIGKMQGLKILRFKSLFHSENKILNDMFNLGSLPNLQKLDLSNCLNLNYKVVQAIGSCCPNLKEVHFARCVYVNDMCAEALSKLPLLEYLDLSCCTRLTAAGVLALAQCPRLQALDLSWRSDVPWAMLQAVATLPTLKALFLNHTKVTTAHLVQLLHQCPSIVYLSVLCCSEVDGPTLHREAPHCQINLNRLREVPYPASLLHKLYNPSK